MRRKRTGHFWQGRFGCIAMDEEHLAAALRYVSLNPVGARLVDRARDWRCPACVHISAAGTMASRCSRRFASERKTWRIFSPAKRGPKPRRED